MPTRTIPPPKSILRNFIICNTEYARILQKFMETELLPSVGFLTLSSLFLPLVFAIEVDLGSKLVSVLHKPPKAIIHHCSK